MNDFITAKEFNPGPNFHKQLDGGMFTFTLKSKTGKKKIIKQHNELGAVNNVLDILSKYARALPWMELSSVGAYGNEYPQAFRNYLKTSNWIGIDQFIGVDGTTDISGTDTKIKGHDIVGWALSSTQNNGPRSGILSSSATINSTKDGFTLNRKFTFAEGKGVGVYTGGYLVKNIQYADNSSVYSGSSDSSGGGACFGPFSNNHGYRGIKFAPIFGQGQKFFASLKGASVEYLDANSLSLSEGLFPTESVWCYAKSGPPPWGQDIPSENGFPSISYDDKYPINVQTKRYEETYPYDVQIVDFQGNAIYLTLDTSTSYESVFRDMLMIANDKIALKFYKRISPYDDVYNTYNVICTLTSGGLISSYEVQTVASGVSYAPAYTGAPAYMYTDIFIKHLSGYAYVDERGSISINEWLANPNGSESESQFARRTGTNIDASNNTCILESFSWVQERRARGGCYTPYEGYYKQFDYLDVNTDLCISFSADGDRTDDNSLVFCCRKTSPFFACVQLATPIIKDESDVLTVDYTITVNSPFLGGLL
jgi:hypothetical protein